MQPRSDGDRRERYPFDRPLRRRPEAGPADRGPTPEHDYSAYHEGYSAPAWRTDRGRSVPPPPLTVTATGTIPRVRRPGPIYPQPGRAEPRKPLPRKSQPRNAQRGDAQRGNAQPGRPRPGPYDARRPRFRSALPDRRPEAPSALRHEFVGDWGYRPVVPDRVDGGARVFLKLLFWFAGIVSVELWWLDTPSHSVHGTVAILGAGARIAGMIAGYLLLVQILLMSRVGWLERWIGAHDLLVWHRRLGATLLVAVLAHVVFITVGYAKGAGISPLAQTKLLWTTYEDMISAYVATGILVAIALMAIRSVRRRLPYELWYYLHLGSYLVLLLSYGHQFLGPDLMANGFGRWFWIALYVFVLACIASGRILRPLALNLRHRLRVGEIVAESPDIVSVYITGRRLEDLDARAGQFFRWRFLARRCWWQAHPFSLSAAPNGRWLRLTVKVVGDHTSNLRRLRPGVRVLAEGPWGVFTSEHRRRPSALLIAGGSGIAPIRALLEELPRGTIVLYRARTREEVIFHEELEWLAHERDATLWYVLGSRHDAGPARAFSPKGMRELAPDVRHRDVYLCGPPGLVDASTAALRRLRVPRRQIHLDPFEF